MAWPIYSKVKIKFPKFLDMLGCRAALHFLQPGEHPGQNFNIYFNKKRQLDPYKVTQNS